MSPDIVFHITGAISIFVSTILVITAVKRFREVITRERKIIDLLYAITAFGYTVFFALSQFHFWSERPEAGNLTAKILHTMIMTAVTIDLILRHKRGEC